MEKILIPFSFCLFYFFSLVNLSAIDLLNISNKTRDSLFASLSRQGKYQEGLEYAALGREQARLKFGDTDTLYVAYTSYLSKFYQEMGRYEEAEPFRVEAVNKGAQAFGKYHFRHVIYMNNLAHLYLTTQRFEESESLYHEALKLGAISFGKTHELYGILTGSLGKLYFYMERYEQAETYNLEALKIFESSSSKIHIYQTIALNNIALLYEKMKRYNLAEQHALKSLDIMENRIGKNHIEYATTLTNLAGLYEQMGNYEKAHQMYLVALNIRLKILGKHHPNYANSLNNLVSLNKNMEQDRRAWDFAHQAINAMSQHELKPEINKAWVDQLKQITYPSNLQITNMERTLGKMFELLAKGDDKNQQKQVLLADLAMHLLKKSRDSYFNDQDKLRLLAKSHDWMLRSLEILDLKKDIDQAFDYVEFHKSALLLQETLTSKAYQFGILPDSLINKERNMSKNHSELQAKLLKNWSEKENDSLRTLLNKLNLQIAAFKKQVENEYPKYAQLQYQTHQNSIQEIQQKLDKKEALIEYVMGDSTLYIIFIDQQQALIKKKHISQSISVKINNYRKQLSNFTILDDLSKNYNELSLLGQWFYNHLIAPVKEQIEGKKHLIIVPDGELYHLPFETFIVTTAKKPRKNLKIQTNYITSSMNIK